jgi:hypothetical protein
MSAGSLPPGLTLAATTGQIAGTPTTSGSFSFSVRVADSGSPAQIATASYTIGITVTASPLVINTTSLPSGTVGTTYSSSLSASGGTPGYSWTVTSGGLPAGLTLSSGGQISGTPSTSGTSNFNVQVTDSGSQSLSRALSISIATSAPAPTGSLLTGCTVSSNNQPSCGIPSGWTLFVADGFENGSTASSSEYFLPACANCSAVDTANPHTGTHSLHGQNSTGWGDTLPQGHREFYLSWYEYLDSNASLNDEMFAAHVKSQVNNWEEVVVDWCGDQGGSFNKGSCTVMLEPQGLGSNAHYGNLYGPSQTLPTGAWHQYEIHWVNNTATCSGGCSDGTLQMWMDGAQWMNMQNVNLTGAQDMYNTYGMTLEAGGHYTKLLWLKNCTDTASCQALVNAGGPYACGAQIGDGYGINVTIAQASVCPPTAPTFNRYLDDVVVLIR